MMDKEDLIDALEMIVEGDMETNINIELNVRKRPPAVPKKLKKKLDFDGIWNSSQKAPNVYFVPLLEVNRKQMYEYARWWAREYNLNLTANETGDEFILEDRNDDTVVKIYHDNNSWYCVIS